MSTHAIDLDHIERYLALDPKTRHGISDATALELVTALRRERETVTRYERFLRALTATDSRAALLDKTDLGEWAEEQAQTLLDGGEAELILRGLRRKRGTRRPAPIGARFSHVAFHAGQSINPCHYPYVWAWRSRPLTRIGQTDSGRKGEACRVIARGGRNTALVEFASDGAKFYTSRNALRRRK